jgi:Ca2+-binding EF-hand superfamily protein
MGPGHLDDAQRIFLMAAGTWDSNHDDQVTCAEWQGYLVELMASADKSGDGTLSEEEFATIVQADRLFATADFAFWDADRDGKITRSEMIERPNPAFTILDRDKDCVLTDSELSAARSLQQPPKMPGGPPVGKPGGGPGGGPPGGGSPGGS